MSLPSLQLGVPVNKLLSSGGRDSAEAAGRDLPVCFGNDLVVTHGHQEEGFSYYQVSLRDVIRACAHKCCQFPKGKIKVIMLYFALIYCTGTRREGLKFIKSHT